MPIRYEIRTIENSQGTGNERSFVRIVQQQSLTPARLEAAIQEMSSATIGDVKAVLSALRYFAARELAQGRRFHVPGMGYLSLSVGFKVPPEKLEKKLTARNVCVRGLNFRPEHALLRRIKTEAAFEKAEYSTLSTRYEADALWQNVEAYLKEHRYLTQRAMQTEFGLSRYKAGQWLKRFVDEGRLTKEGSRSRWLYFAT